MLENRLGDALVKLVKTVEIVEIVETVETIETVYIRVFLKGYFVKKINVHPTT